MYVSLEGVEIISVIVTAIATVIGLPFIWVTLRQTKKQQSMEKGSQSLQAYLEAKKYLNSEFDHHGHNFRYYFNKAEINQNAIEWKKGWHDKENVFGYIRASYLKKKILKESLEKIKKSKYGALHFVIDQFCDDVEDFLQTIDSFNGALGNEPRKSINKHPVVEIYSILKDVL